MVKRQTWVLLVVFLALVGFALYQKYTPSTAKTGSTPAATFATQAFIFPAQEGAVTSILIESNAGKSFAAENRSGTWVVTQPVEAEATPGSMEAAASQITALTVQERLNLDPTAVGLRISTYTLTVGFSSGKFFVLQIGDETPTGEGYYVHSKEGDPVLVVSKSGLSALLGLLDNPPVPATITPSPAPPTETPTETSTPTATIEIPTQATAVETPTP